MWRQTDHKESTRRGRNGKEMGQRAPESAQRGYRLLMTGGTTTWVEANHTCRGQRSERARRLPGTAFSPMLVRERGGREERGREGGRDLLIVLK